MDDTEAASPEQLVDLAEQWMRDHARAYAAWDPAVELSSTDRDAVELVVFTYADHLRGSSFAMLNLLRDVLADIKTHGHLTLSTLTRVIGTVEANCSICDRPPLLDNDGNYAAGD